MFLVAYRSKLRGDVRILNHQRAAVTLTQFIVCRDFCAKGVGATSSKGFLISMMNQLTVIAPLNV